MAGGNRPVASISHRPLATRHGSLATRRLPQFTVYCLLITFLLLPATGCRLIRGVADAPGQAVRVVTPGKKDKNAIDPVVLQQALLRFADAFSTRMVVGVDQLRRGTNALDRAEVLRWKIALANETCAIATGPNAVANLLDMTVFVTVMRASLEEHWRPRVFGDSAQPLLDSCRDAETNVWQFTGRLLNPAQQAELRQAIARWRQQNPLPENVLAARAVGFASRVAEASQTDTTRPENVFSLLNVDPLAGMDPAVRELAQTRLFAERAIFLTQKMPMLLRWQTELLAGNALEIPAVQQLVTNSTQIAASVDRFAVVAEKLPAQLSTERQGILKALEAQEKNLSPLVSEVRQTLTAGSQMSTSLNTTLTTFDAVMKRFGVGETNQSGSPGTNAQPFRIQDYGQTAAQLEAAARQLTELLHMLSQTLDSTNLSRLSAQVTPVVQQAQTGGKEIVDYAFRKALLFLALVLLAALAYRFLAARMTPVTSQPPPQTHHDAPITDH